MDDLSFAAYCAKAVLKFLDCLGKQGLGHALTIIKPKWQQDLVAAPTFHTQRNLRS
jgi:hypothetical protein